MDQESKKKAGNSVRALPAPAGTTLLRTYHRLHFSLYNKPRTRAAGLFFLLFTLEDGTDRLSRNVGKRLPLLAASLNTKRDRF